MTVINRFFRQIKASHRIKSKYKKQNNVSKVSTPMSYEEIIKRYDELLM